jgi:hypothetical protein
MKGTLGNQTYTFVGKPNGTITTNTVEMINYC